MTSGKFSRSQESGSGRKSSRSLGYPSGGMWGSGDVISGGFWCCSSVDSILDSSSSELMLTIQRLGEGLEFSKIWA